MATEKIFLGHDNKRDITKPSKLLRGRQVRVGQKVKCPRCGSWTAFEGSAHGKLNKCVGSCGLWYGTLGTTIQLTDEDPQKIECANCAEAGEDFAIMPKTTAQEQK